MSPSQAPALPQDEPASPASGLPAVETINSQWIDEIDRLGLSARAARLKESLLNGAPGVDSERVRLTIESWKETEGEPLEIRRAKMVRKLAEEFPLVIFPGQLLADNETKFYRGANPNPDYDASYLLPLLAEDETALTLGGPVEKAQLSDEDRAVFLEACEFWKGKTAGDKIRRAVEGVMGTWYDDLVETGVTRYEAVPQVASCWMFEKVINDGLCSFIEEAVQCSQDFLENKEDDIDKLNFRKSAIIALEAVGILARRYSRLASEMAQVEEDQEVRSELEEIAAACQWVPENPARTFREALQSLTLVSLALRLESPMGRHTGWGQMDQYLYPFLKRDLERGQITIEKAADLVADFLLNCARQEIVISLSWRDQHQKGYPSNIGLGGFNNRGVEDGSNELTYLLLHLMGLLRLPEPHLFIRWHKGMPRWVMRKAIETNALAGGGVPQYHNAQHIVDDLVERGVDLEAARCFQSHGCSQSSSADSPSAMLPSYFNIPLYIDLALHNGVCSKSGKMLGVETGDPRDFSSFKELYDAFIAQMEHVSRKELWHDRMVDRLRPVYYRQPLASALMPGCIQSGVDYSAGGMKHYANWYKKDRGFVPAGDSLTAVKSLVFDEKKLTMAQLLDAVDSNFAGPSGEKIRQLCLLAPKYGNDTDEPDRMVRDIGKHHASYAINRNGEAWHFSAGKKLPALPNGRRANEPLADGSLSASQGMDRKGPTALLNSAIRADFKEAEAAILTVSLPASIFRSEPLQEKLIDLTEGFLRRGGTQIQYNIIDVETLKDARRNPENHKDLLVRVGGYSAFFTTLSPEVQDEIITRTEHEL
jgi:formate C-acetyltransferase